MGFTLTSTMENSDPTEPLLPACLYVCLSVCLETGLYSVAQTSLELSDPSTSASDAGIIGLNHGTWLNFVFHWLKKSYHLTCRYLAGEHGRS